MIVQREIQDVASQLLRFITASTARGTSVLTFTSASGHLSYGSWWHFNLNYLGGLARETTAAG